MVDNTVTDPAERNKILRWWLDQQTDLDKALLRSQAKGLQAACKRADRLPSLGEMGAVELLWALGRWMNENGKTD